MNRRDEGGAGSTPGSPMYPRKAPSLRYAAQLIRLKKPIRGRDARRLSRVHDITDLRNLAERTAPQVAFAYVEGGADRELSVENNRARYESVRLEPKSLVDVTEVNLSTKLFGREYAVPFGFGPTGFTRMLHAQGEGAVWSAATVRNVPYVLSSFGTTRYERLAASTPDGANPPWFQLYLMRERARTGAVLDELEAAGCDTLMITVDTPVGGNRLRDKRLGIEFPPSLTLKTMIDAAIHPRWWVNLLTTEPMGFAYGATGRSGAPVLDKSALTQLINPAVTWNDLEHLRERWKGNLVVKGVQSAADARLAEQVGVDGIVLSNHGGRQLDATRSPLDVLPEAREALHGGTKVMLDSGVRNGADVVAALASGADFVFLGRAYLYGLMAAGEAGVAKVIDLIEAESRRTMQLLGASRISALSPDMIVK